MSSLTDILKQEDKGLVLSPIVDDYLFRSANLGKGGRTGYHPSSLHNLLVCLRKAYYSHKGYETPQISTELAKIFKIGHAIHREVKDWFKGAGILVKSEFKFKNKKYGIKGTLDDIVRVDDEYYIVEVKSIVERRFDTLVSPLPEHNCQLQTYIWMFNELYKQYPNKGIFKEIGKPIKKGIVYYVNKVYVVNDDEYISPMMFNSRNIIAKKEFVVDFDQKLVDIILLRIEELDVFIKEGIIPPRLLSQTDKECKYCDFYDECWEEK